MVPLLKTSQSEMRDESVWADRERGRHHETKLVGVTGINHSSSATVVLSRALSFVSGSLNSGGVVGVPLRSETPV